MESIAPDISISCSQVDAITKGNGRETVQWVDVIVVLI